MSDGSGLDQAYPTLARWVHGGGWLEVGHVYWSPSLIRILDEGGLVWEGGALADTLSAAFALAEAALTTWLREQSGDR
jgi:hypothetical protein